MCSLISQITWGNAHSHIAVFHTQLCTLSGLLGIDSVILQHLQTRLMPWEGWPSSAMLCLFSLPPLPSSLACRQCCLCKAPCSGSGAGQEAAYAWIPLPSKIVVPEKSCCSVGAVIVTYPHGERTLEKMCSETQTWGLELLHSWYSASLHCSISLWSHVSADRFQALDKVRMAVEGKSERKREMPLVPYIVLWESSVSCPEL